MTPYVNPSQLPSLLWQSYLYVAHNLEAVSHSLASLPRGHIVHKTRGSHTYYYRQFWQEGKQIQQYIRLRDLEATRQALRDRQQLLSQQTTWQAMLKTIARALRCFDVDVQKRMVQHTTEEWLQREDAAKRKRAVEEAKAKPYAENYRYLVALQEGYVMVASKSEALILQELVALGVPVEYEPTIEIEGRTYKGDFRVRNKNHEEIEYYWEHLGMLKDARYRERWKEKEEAYRRAGIEEGRNLLVTRDEEDGGVDMVRIHNIILQYLVL